MFFFVKDMLELICNYLLNYLYPVKDSSRNNYEVTDYTLLFFFTIGTAKYAQFIGRDVRLICISFFSLTTRVDFMLLI